MTSFDMLSFPNASVTTTIVFSLNVRLLTLTQECDKAYLDNSLLHVFDEPERHRFESIIFFVMLVNNAVHQYNIFI